MKHNEMKKYISPSLEISKLEISDVISTSGFLGGDHIFSATDTEPATENYAVMYLSIESIYETYN